MGLPEVNRARIEKMIRDFDALQGKVDTIDPIIVDESYPDLVSGAPQGVTASALFRTIAVSWQYHAVSYIATYEVYASTEKDFTPREQHLVWRGKAGGFTFPASLGQTWYFRVRTLNYHGNASDFSAQVSATTTSISHLEIDEQYQIDTIEYANQYTKDREFEIMQHVADKLDASVYHENIVLKADTLTVQNMYDALEDRIGTAEVSLGVIGDDIEGRALKVDLDSATDRIEVSEGLIQANANAINLRVTKETYDKDISDEGTGLFARMTKAEGSITTIAGEVELKATEQSVVTRIGDVVHELEDHDARITTNATAITQRVTTTTYNALAQRVGTAEGSITTQAGQIALKASQADLNSAKGRLDTAEATLTVLPGQISSKVEKNGVISAIRQSAESLKIQAAKVDINGDLTVTNGLVRLKDAVVDRLNIKEGVLTRDLFANNAVVDEINAGTAKVDFAKIGNVVITNAHITGRLTANQLTIGSGTTFNSGYDPTTKETPTGAQSKADAAKDAAIAHSLDNFGNLVKNPQVTGNHTGWSASGLSSVMQTFEGLSTRVLQSSVSADTQNYSTYFKVDPSKAYEVSMWIKKSASGQYYVGLNGLNSAGTNTGFVQVSQTGATTNANNTNFYFQSGTVSTTWTKIIGYIMPVGTTPADMKEIGTSSSAIMKSTHDRIRVRFLNWSNAGTTRQLWVAHPKVVEVDPNAIIRGTRSKELTDKWRYGNTLEIDGANMRANTIDANVLKANSVIANNITFSGRLSGATGSFSGDISASNINGSSFSSYTSHSNGRIAHSLSIDEGDLAMTYHTSAGILQQSLYMDYNGMTIGNAFQIYATDRLSLRGVDGIRVRTGTGYGDLGSRNSNYFHMSTDRPQFYMYQPLQIQGRLAESIVSEGSNANGHWIRYQSGLQICWAQPFSMAISTASNSIYRSDVSLVWTYPASFATGTPVGVSGGFSATQRWIGTTSVPSGGNVYIRGYSSVSSTSAYTVYTMAIGRWK